MTWSDAAKACKEVGGLLAHPENAQENEQISQLAKGDVTWIGARSIFGFFGFRKLVWQNGTALEENYQNWGQGMPRKLANTDCVAIW